MTYNLPSKYFCNTTLTYLTRYMDFLISSFNTSWRVVFYSMLSLLFYSILFILLNCLVELGQDLGPLTLHWRKFYLCLSFETSLMQTNQGMPRLVHHLRIAHLSGEVELDFTFWFLIPLLGKQGIKPLAQRLLVTGVHFHQGESNHSYLSSCCTLPPQTCPVLLGDRKLGSSKTKKLKAMNFLQHPCHSPFRLKSFEIVLKNVLYFSASQPILD